MTQPKPRPLKTPTPSNSPVSTATPEHVKAMRAFNRFYTQRIGMLSPYLGSEFSLTEVRILYELAHHPAHAEQPLTATALARTLELDMGYLSRILRRFEGRKWVRRSPAPTDARQSLLTLTAAGFKAFSPLQQRSRDDAASLLDAVPVLQQARVIDAMQTIQSLLQPEGSTPPQVVQPAQAAEPAIVLRDPQPGDLGWVVQQHGEIYAREYGFHWPVSGVIARTACFAVALGLGAWVAKRKSWLNLLNGSLLGAIVFYVVTNTQSWAADPFYAKTLAGWWQALTVGHPEYPPTVFFFRNTLFGDLMFTGLFAGIMEWIAHTKKEPCLLDPEPGEDKPVESPVPVEPEN